MGKYAFINGIVLNGHEDMEPGAGKAVLVEDDQIRAVADADSVDLSGYEVIDLNGRYLMPGLVNPHVHLGMDGTNEGVLRAYEPENLKDGVIDKVFLPVVIKSAQTALNAGITTVRSVGGFGDLDTRVRDMIDRGEIEGPRVLACNMAITVENGHGAGSMSYVVATEEEAKAEVDRLAEQKVDWIKLMITGGVTDAVVKGEPGILRMPGNLVKASCDRAHERGLKVAAHIESPEGIRIALENGVDSVEHGAEPDEYIISLFKKNHAMDVTTIAAAMPLYKFPPELSGCDDTKLFNAEVVSNGIIDCARACLENGIDVAIGTDAGCPLCMHYDLWREVWLFAKHCGVSNQFALHTVTQRNAELIGAGDVTGTIDEGKCADLIVLARNPLEDLGALRNIDMVMARGNLIREPEFERNERTDELLDKYMMV